MKVFYVNKFIFVTVVSASENFSSILTLRKIEITSYQLKIASLGDLPSGQIVIQVVYFLCKSRATFVLFIK